MGLKEAARSTELQRKHRERKEFEAMCEQARRLCAYRDARIKVASMSPDEKAAAIAASDRARLARWMADPQTVARLKARGGYLRG